MENTNPNNPEEQEPQSSQIIDDKQEDLVQQAKSNDSTEEKELEPPEDDDSDSDNNEKTLDVTNIFSIALIFIVIAIVLILFFTSFSKKKKVAEKELNTVGNKTTYVFDKEPAVEIDTHEETAEEDLPEQYSIGGDGEPQEEPQPPAPQAVPGKAPAEISSVGSSGSYKSDRPDTRNSKSTRTISGLVQNNQQYGSSSNFNNNSNTSVNQNRAVMPASSNRVNPYTEEYKANELARLQSYYGNYGNSQNSNGGSNYVDNQQFFENNMGNGGSGQYLSEYSVWDGTVIPAALETAINTDNPGVVIARVTENIYSSYDASYLLIPEGTLLYATYNSSVSYGQHRIQVAWNLLIRPDGYRVVLGNMNGVDSQGASGYVANVSNHPFETLKALGLVAMYSIIQTEVTKDIKSEQNEYIKNSITDVYSQASQISNKIVDKALNIKPRLTIPSGREVKIITNMPLTLPPVEINKPSQKYIRH